MKKVVILLSLFVSANAQSLSFDGEDDYVSINQNNAVSGVSGVSLGFWVKDEWESDKEMFIDFGGASGVDTPYRYVVVKEDDKLKAWVEGTSFGSTSTLVTYSYDQSSLQNNWIYATAVFTTSSSTLYLNGNSVGTASFSYSGDYAIFDSNGDYHIGKNTGASGFEVSGNLGEVAIWDTALTADEVSTLYGSGSVVDASANSGSYVSSSNLKGYWKMNEGTGTTLSDATSNGNDGTINGLLGVRMHHRLR